MDERPGEPSQGTPGGATEEAPPGWQSWDPFAKPAAASDSGTPADAGGTPSAPPPPPPPSVGSEPTIEQPAVTSVPPPSTQLPPPPPVPAVTGPVGPMAVPPRGPGFSLTAGWGKAVVRAVVAFVVMMILAEAVAFAYYELAGSPRPSGTLTARLGVILFFLFHRVGVVFEARNLTISAGSAAGAIPPGAALSATLALALLGGTAVAAWLLYRAGRAVGKDAGGPAWARALHGLKVAPPYAILCLAATLAVHFSIQIPANPVASGTMTIHPSYVAAVLWPLALGLVLGFAGGLRSAGEEGSGQRVRLLRGAIAGAWRMLLAGLVLAYAGLLILSVVKPSTKGVAYTISGSSREAAGGALATALTLPNRASLVLLPSMGSCVTVSGGASGFGSSICVLSYAHFPAAGSFRTSGINVLTNQPTLPAAPAGYYLFLLVPAAAVLFGGMGAAKRAGAQSRGEAAIAGMLAGVGFAILAAGLAVLSSVALKASGQGLGTIGAQSVKATVGAEVVTTALLALLWGVVGGGLGGLIRGRTLPRRSTAPAAEPGTTPAAGYQDYGFGPSVQAPPPTDPGTAAPPPPP